MEFDSMRDIRDDLRERLKALRQERDALQTQLAAKLAEIDEYEKQVSALLALEDRRQESRQESNGFAPSAKTAVAPKTAEMRNEFERAILDLMGNDKVWDHSDLRHRLESEGWKTSSGSLGRVLHGVLLSLRSRELIVHTGDFGKWRITAQGLGYERAPG
jgi:predicted nuclease with TOPRIM domain